MDLLETKQQYLEGAITKPEFIDQMFAQHQVLRQYAQLAAESEIASISIAGGKVTMTTNHGITMVCNFVDKTSLPLYSLSFGAYEPEEHTNMLSLIEDGDVVFDIGANHGWYSLNIGKRFPSCQIYAFEPMKKTLEFFKENIALNGLENVRPYNLGFWKEDAVLEFNYYEDTTGGTSIGDLFGRADVQKVPCTVRMLDHFVQEEQVDRIDFIKIDIEGAELFALQGGEAALRQHKPKLFVEMLRKWAAKFGYHPNDIIRFMQGLGYQCFDIEQNRLCPFTTMTDETLSTNFFFLHAEKHAPLIQSRLK